METHNITTEVKVLPENYWEIIENYLPDYSSSQRVCDSNDLAKYINGEMEEDEFHTSLLNNLKENYGFETVDEAKKVLLDIDTRLYLAAVKYI